jgi:hypothetical protein
MKVLKKVSTISNFKQKSFAKNQSDDNTKMLLFGDLKHENNNEKDKSPSIITAICPNGIL